MPAPPATLRALPALLLGTLSVGVLDGAFAIVRAAFNGVPPQRVMQSIAAGLLGRAAFQGGTATALLGAGLHFIIAGMVVLTYFLASRRLPILTRHPLLCGAIYGLLVFAVMNFIVIPLSALTIGPRSLVRMLPGMTIHILGVGFPAALVAGLVPARRPPPGAADRAV
jgi:hypothetical protein